MEQERNEEKIPGMQVGIDLGTSNSTVAYYKDGKCHFLEVRNKRLIPSVIFFSSRDELKWDYGEVALRKGIMYPDSVFQHFKRHIGEQTKLKFTCEDNAEIKTEPKTYIIDTNVFVDSPFILDVIPPEDKIIIPKTVYEELSYRKDQADTSEKAQTAEDELEKYKDRIEYADSDLTLLPDKDMFKAATDNHNLNDNKILSVAMQHNEPNTIVLSSDRGVADKGLWLRDQGAVFQVVSLEAFQWQQTAKPNDDAELELTGKDGAVYFLRYLKREIEKELGPVSRAVITVPMGFSPIQTSEIKDAGLEAGFSEVEVHPEPIAAAVAYGLNQDEDKIILVYDFGGGTFDVSILRKEGDDFHLLASDGDPKLGGEDFTRCLVEDFEEALEEDLEFDMNSEETSGLSHEEYMKNKLRIWSACEQLKCALSEEAEDTVEVKLFTSPGKQVEYSYSCTREDFNDITAKLCFKARDAVERAMNNAGLKREDIDVVVMAGGTSTIPNIRDAVERYFGKKPYSDRDPATLIAEGAASFADIRWNENSSIERKIHVFETTMEDFGVGLRGNRFDCIIPADTDLPVRVPKTYMPAVDNPDQLDIMFFTRTKGSKATVTMDDAVQFIGRVYIKDIPPHNREDVDVEVTFEITKEYVLNVDVQLVDHEGNEISKAAMKIEKVGV